MRLKCLIAVLALVAGALACTAPGAADTGTPAVVTVVVTSAGAAGATQASTEASTGQATAPSGINCTVQQEVRVHSCVGASSASVLGSSPTGSQFAPTKWDGQNWFYGQIPTGGGPTWGWVSRLNTDGSTLVACTGDTSALPRVSEPCPTAIPPTPTYTPLPPTDTPTPLPTVTSTTSPAALCGNGVADTGEECGEPVFKTCAVGRVCRSCKCVLPLFQLTPVLIQP